VPQQQQPHLIHVAEPRQCNKIKATSNQFYALLAGLRGRTLSTLLNHALASLWVKSEPMKKNTSSPAASAAAVSTTIG
jgi:hypothetical protein